MELDIFMRFFQFNYFNPISFYFIPFNHLPKYSFVINKIKNPPMKRISLLDDGDIVY